MSETKRKLYRDSDNGKFAGVCAGLADFFGFEVWLVRVVTASAIILTGVFGLPLLIYIIGWFLLDKKPASEEPKPSPHISVKSKVWQSGELPRQALYDIKDRFAELEVRLRRLEGQVTSSAFSLKREINKL
ncbi:envelope stress response membrane protein PspC [Echinimonas agarilytica]|uniref:Envelope stress response membrane protein PspC n=1 Tax=Echinimonas agarilytica TaxID=1215918 RepID=A0AA42B7Q4_9GAMM|nr:envelope stress response membrane protein PspC [Echinimonas agarilytica]MCM2680017.1 envelope stress response membrane protein PspC [Echinimonas agarilytica]